MVDTCRKGKILAFQIGADDVEFNFIESTGTRGGAEKSFSLRMFLAASDSGGEKQQLREGFEIGDSFGLRWRAGNRNGGERGHTGFVEIPGQARDFECGIDLEQK